MGKKIGKALVKRTLETMEELIKLNCQKYESGKCRDLASKTGFGSVQDFCPACQMYEGALLVKAGAERFNPLEQY